MSDYRHLRSAFTAAIIDWDAADSMVANAPVAMARAETALETIQFDMARWAAGQADEEARARATSLLAILDERAASREWLMQRVAESLDEAASSPAETLRLLEDLGRDVEAAKASERTRLVAIGRRSKELMDHLDAIFPPANRMTFRPD